MTKTPEVLNVLQRAGQLSGTYENIVLTEVNDHVVRLSMMTEPYFWHLHPDSDELFVCIEGTLVLEVDQERIELSAGDTFTVPKGVKHRTAPLGARSVNLTVERVGTTTIRSDGF